MCLEERNEASNDKSKDLYNWLMLKSTEHILEGERIMSKYEDLWKYVKKSECEALKLSFKEVESIIGIPIDHSFLKYKKDLIEYGYQVGRISMKEETIVFEKIKL